MLLKNSADFNQYSDALAGINFNSITPSIKQAELRYIVPIIGNALFDDLNTKHNGAGATGKDAVLLTKLNTALSSLVLYLYAPITEVQLSDKGLRRGHSEAMPGAFKYQVQEYRTAILDRGFEALEDAIRYLEANASDFTLWTASPEFTLYRSLLIRTGDELHQYYSGIKYPRRLYTLLQSTMYNVQELFLKPALGEVYTDIMALQSMASPDYSEEQIELLKSLKRCIAHHTIAQGLPQILATMDENGVHVLTIGVDSTHSQSKRVSASDNHLSLIVSSATATANAWFDAAKDYLNATATADIFPSWYAKLQAEAQAISMTDNCTSSGAFSM